MEEAEKIEQLPDDKIRVKLFDAVLQAESKEEKKVDIQILLLDLFDDLLADRANDLTPEQIGKMVRLRSKIEIELKEF